MGGDRAHRGHLTKQHRELCKPCGGVRKASWRRLIHGVKKKDKWTWTEGAGTWKGHR